MYIGIRDVYTYYNGTAVITHLRGYLYLVRLFFFKKNYKNNRILIIKKKERRILSSIIHKKRNHNFHFYYEKGFNFYCYRHRRFSADSRFISIQRAT